MCDNNQASKDIWFTCDGECIHTTKMHPGVVQKFVETVNKTCAQYSQNSSNHSTV